MLPIGSVGSGMFCLATPKLELEIQPHGELDLSCRRHKTGRTKCRIGRTAHTITKLLWNRAQECRCTIDWSIALTFCRLNRLKTSALASALRCSVKLNTLCTRTSVVYDGSPRYVFRPILPTRSENGYWSPFTSKPASTV